MKYKEFKEKFLDYSLFLDSLLKNAIEKSQEDLFYPYCILKEDYKNPVLVYFDINLFMKFNYENGHKKGDEVLAKIEEVLANTLYSREGGDSFFFIVEKDEYEDYLKAIKEILKENDLTFCSIIINLKTFKIIDVEIIFELLYFCKNSNHYENKKLVIDVENI